MPRHTYFLSQYTALDIVVCLATPANFVDKLKALGYKLFMMSAPRHSGDFVQLLGRLDSKRQRQESGGSDKGVTCWLQKPLTVQDVSWPTVCVVQKLAKVCFSA